MRYTDLLSYHIDSSGMSLQKISDKLKSRGISIDRTYISKLKHGKTRKPASDEINIALSEVLGIDSTELRVAAVFERIGPELFQLIKDAG